ncbi:MAG TPA: SDR family NAD(P)-dependent oxidoreductase [Acidimicrobiales bacterium]
MDLNGSSAIVTGGGSGLGAATVRLLSQRGAKVVVVDMKEETGKAVADEVDGVFVGADVADPDQVIAAVDAAVDLGPLRSMVTAAGIGWATRTVGKDGEYSSAHDLGVFSKVIEVNLIGTFNCIRLAATKMGQQEPVDEFNQRGAIVSVASVAAFDGQIGQASYSASKGGVVGMTLPVARDLAAVGVRLNCIAPGLIDTPIYGQGEAAEQFKEKLGASVLFPRRLGQADEFASMAVELIENDYMNAETIRLDGGIRMPPK